MSALLDLALAHTVHLDILVVGEHTLDSLVEEQHNPLEVAENILGEVVRTLGFRIKEVVHCRIEEVVHCN